MKILKEYTYPIKFFNRRRYPKYSIKQGPFIHVNDLREIQTYIFTEASNPRVTGVRLVYTRIIRRIEIIDYQLSSVRQRTYSSFLVTRDANIWDSFVRIINTILSQKASFFCLLKCFFFFSLYVLNGS